MKIIKMNRNPLADTPTMHQTGHNLPLGERTELNSLINLSLASAIDLQLQLKQAHWNVKGPYSTGLHELFDNIGDAVENYVDMIAERIVQRGGTAEGTVRMAAASSRLDEYPLMHAESMAHVNMVATALSTFDQQACVTIGEADELDDAGTADLFTEISRGINKWLWFVEAHLQTAN